MRVNTKSARSYATASVLTERSGFDVDKTTDIKSAIARVKNGDSIMIGGFTNYGCPLNLVYELAKHPEIKELTIISEDMGYGGLPYKQAQGALVANGQVKEIIVSFIGGNKDVNNALINNELKATLVPQGTLAERIRAGGAGLGGFYTPTGVGTVVEQGKETKVINGKKYLLELPLRANVAFIKARRADKMGNAVFRYTGANFNTVMATAADIVILETEELVECGEIEPDQVQLPGIFVDYIVCAGVTF